MWDPRQQWIILHCDWTAPCVRWHNGEGVSCRLYTLCNCLFLVFSIFLFSLFILSCVLSRLSFIYSFGIYLKKMMSKSLQLQCRYADADGELTVWQMTERSSVSSADFHICSHRQSKRGLTHLIFLTVDVYLISRAELLSKLWLCVCTQHGTLLKLSQQALWHCSVLQVICSAVMSRPYRKRRQIHELHTHMH